MVDSINPAKGAYFDLYLDLMLDIQHDLELTKKMEEKDGAKTVTTTTSSENDDNGEVNVDVVLQGHRDYLAYRKNNDPARPMLTRLYGHEWTEEVISEILFKMI